MSIEGATLWRQQHNQEQEAARNRETSMVDAALSNPNLQRNSPEWQSLVHRRMQLMTPQESTSFISRIGALIHGQKLAPAQPGQQSQPARPAQHSTEPTTNLPPTSGVLDWPVQPSTGKAAEGAPTHPFKHSTVLAHIEQGLKGLESRLKGVAQPVASAPKDESWKAAVERNYTTPEELKLHAQAESEKAKLEQIKTTAASKPPTQIRQTFKTAGDMLPEGATDENGNAIERDPNTIWQRDPMDPTKWQQIPGQWSIHTVGNRAMRVNAQTGESELLRDGNGNELSPVQLGRMGYRQIMSPVGLVWAKTGYTPNTTPATPPPAPKVSKGDLEESPLDHPENLPPTPEGEPPNPTLKIRPGADRRAKNDESIANGPALAAPSPSVQALNKKLNSKRSASRQIPTGSTTAAAAPAHAAPAKSGEKAWQTWPSPLGSMVRSAGQAKLAQDAAHTFEDARVQITGKPGDKPMWEESWIFDNPRLRNAIQSAVQLSAEQLPKDQAGILAAFLTRLPIQGRITNMNAAKDEVVKLGGNEANDLLTSFQELNTAMMGIRKQLNAPAAVAIVDRILQEGPVFSVNGHEFVFRTAKLLDGMAALARTTPGINPSYAKKIDDLSMHIRSLLQHPVSSKAPQVPSSTGAPKKSKSLAAAMALPFNKGKSKEQVSEDLKKHGYEVAP